MQAMEAEPGRLAGFGVKFGGAVAAVLQELDAGQRGAEADVECAPLAGLAQRSAQVLDGVAEKPNGWHPGQPAAFP